MKSGCQTVFELILMDGELMEIRTRAEAGYRTLSEKDTATAEEFIRAYYKNIVEKWMNFFGCLRYYQLLAATTGYYLSNGG